MLHLKGRDKMKSLFLWLIKTFKDEFLFLPGKFIGFLVCIFLFILPLLNNEPHIMRIFIMTFIFAIFAASWDLLSGFLGQMSLGHALFFGVAAYTSAMLNMYLEWEPLLTIPLGAVAAVLMGLIVGVPALRLRGPYLSLATLAFPIILLGIVYIFRDITGGELGIYGLSRLGSTMFQEYYITLILMVTLGLVMWKITDSKVGIIFHAIREDEIAVRASGINTTKYKLLAFSLSGFFAGIAGGLSVHFIRIAGPSTLELMTSFQPIIWTIFGGIVTIYGAIAGTLILYPLMEFLRVVPELRMLIFAGSVLVILRFMPEGLIVWLLDKLERECPRCKVKNIFTRTTCRICLANLK